MSTNVLAQVDSAGDLGTAQRIVDEYDRVEVRDHPLFVALRQRPVDYSTIWLLMANLQASISHHFVRWLASVIARTDDSRIACLLAKQLDDELGNGEFSAIHSRLLARFVSGLAEFSELDSADEALLAPGRKLLSEMSAIFEANDVYEGLGALMVSEIFAKKMDHCVGDELRRQSALSGETLRWLDLHEKLEAEHADDSYELAVLVPKQESQVQAAWRGARAQWNALWGLLDEVHALSSGAPRVPEHLDM